MKTVEQAYKEYKEWVRKDKERLCIDFERALKALGMWEVDVIRNHDGAVGQFKIVIPKTPWKDPKIEFFKYKSNGQLSINQSGQIPYQNAEKYLQSLFRIWNPKRRHNDKL